MEFTVTLAATGVAVTLKDGRLVDVKGRPVYSEKVFDDEMSAEFWLLNDLFAQFTGGHIATPYWREIVAKKKSRSYQNSPTIAALEAAGVEPTLDAWLEWNEVTEFSYELLESLPEEFHDEYCDLVRLGSEYDKKWQERQRREQ